LIWCPESIQNDFVEDVDEELVNPTDKRIFAISTAFHRGYSVDKVWQMTNIDKWFLTKLHYIYIMEKHLSCVIVAHELQCLLTQMIFQKM
jgi:carbamoyl-phosphate synthase/aspartate carbamoyltransferase